MRALGQADTTVGPIPSNGARATLTSIKPFVDYMINALTADIASMLEFVYADREKTWWFEGEIISFSTDTPSRILRLLQRDPNASLTTISKMLGISRSAIQQQVDKLEEKDISLVLKVKKGDGL